MHLLVVGVSGLGFMPVADLSESPGLGSVESSA